jgi:hypothetical protein
MHRLRRFISLPVAEQVLTLEAATWLAAARVAVALFPVRWIAPWLGTLSSESVCQHQAPPPRHLRALRRALHNAPWTGTCLMQAIGAKLYLRRHGILSTLWLGVVTRDDLKAHAWLRVGDQVVTGEAAESGYQPLGCFE